MGNAGVENCTIATCPLSEATIDYVPTLPGSLLFLALFGLFLLIQGCQLFRHRTWSYSCSMMSGLVLEVVGYLGRVQMHYNPFEANPFLIYIICLTIGPVFFTAALYLVLSRVIVHYGAEHSRLSPKTISISFMVCDFIALLLQSAGGAIADTAPTEFGSNQGTWIMVGGLSFQVLSLLIFMALAVEFTLNVRSARKFTPADEKAADVNGNTSASFKRFLCALTLATIFILTRSIFRVAELSKGFGSRLANEEVPFMVLEGAMIVLATGLMTFYHPGSAFGAVWPNAGWTWKNGKKSADAEKSAGSAEGSVLK